VGLWTSNENCLIDFIYVISFLIIQEQKNNTNEKNTQKNDEITNISQI